MRNVFLLLIILLLAISCKKNGSKSRITELDSISYYLGFEAGEHFKKYGIDSLNTAEFEKGLAKALYSDSVVFSVFEKAEIKHKILAYKKELENRLNEKNQRLAQHFLAQNARRKGVKRLKSGLQIRILHRTKNKAIAKEYVYLRYKIYTINGKLIDSSGKKALLFRRKKLISAMKEALKYMRKGDRFRLYTPPELAFGKKYPLQTGIEPGMALIIDLELVN